MALIRRLSFFSRADNQPPVKRSASNQYRIFSAAEKQFLRDHWQLLTNVEMASALGRTRSSINSMGSDLGLIKTPEARSRALSRQWKKQQNGKDVAWSAPDRVYLQQHYAHTANTDLGQALGRSAGAVKRKALSLGLKKTAELIRSLQKRPNAGQFKKGSLPANTVYGEELVIRIRNHKKGPSYKWIRTGFKTWMQYHRSLWIQQNGPIPKGHIVVFVNGDQMDVRLDNLTLITLRQNRLRNSGSVNLTDGYVANALAWHDPEGKQAMLQQPGLLALKRAQLKLDRQLNQPAKS